MTHVMSIVVSFRTYLLPTRIFVTWLFYVSAIALKHGDKTMNFSPSVI